MDLRFETDFWRLPQDWGSCSKRRDKSDVLEQRFGADWCYYNPYMRTRILERKYQALRQLSRPICTANYLTGFDHDLEIPGWEEDEGSIVQDDRTGGAEGGLSQLVENNNADTGQSSKYDAFNDVSMAGGNQTGNDVDHTATIRDFLLDIGLSESNLLGTYPRCKVTCVADWDCR